MSEPVHSTCPYCGVGCGVVAERTDDGQFSIRGDPQHPANYGRLCSKGAALADTLGLQQRLLYPEIMGHRVSWQQAITTVADSLQSIISEHGPDAVAFYVSGQLLTEEYYVANKLIKGFIGTANIDTNSRLCMASSVAGQRRAFGADTVPGCYEDLERAKLVVLAGSNLAWCHPVLFQRLTAAKAANPDLMIVVIDPRRTTTAEVADLHLALRPGSDGWLFNGLLAFLDDAGERHPSFVSRCVDGVSEALQAARQTAPDITTVAALCDLPAAQVENFYRLFARTERVVTVYSQGINQSSSGTDKVNAIINCHLYTGRIGRPGMGPFSVTGQPNAMGGREAGGLANQLAAHMELENPLHRDWVQEFWQAPRLAQRPGLKAVELFQAIEAGTVKAVWIMATNPLVSMPDALQVQRALARAELVVVSDCVSETDTLRYAHVRLPALAWGEKDGTVTNSERRISRQRAFLTAPGEARADWQIISDVASAMGFGTSFDYQSPLEIFREHAALSGYHNNGERDFNLTGLAALSSDDYQGLVPVQWPVIKDQGRSRMFDDERFFTPNGRARMIAIQPRAPVMQPNAEFPLRLNTGRVRDHWHTMTRTARAPQLNQHLIEPYLAIHPDDGAAFGVVDGELVTVASRLAEIIVRVCFDAGQRHGEVFIPMHWNDQYSGQARVDTLIAAATDPVSGQPELKHMPVRIYSYRPLWQAVIVSRHRLELPVTDYWTLVPGDQVLRYELAGRQRPDSWSRWAETVLGVTANDDWIEYEDRRLGYFRGALCSDQSLKAYIIAGPDVGAVSRGWLQQLSLQSALSAQDRVGLLAGRPLGPVVDHGRIVCACFGVGETVILDAISHHNCRSVEDISRHTRAGSNCGACKPELSALLSRASALM
ncbi:MAG: molybdopterin-dependent oxidoreductase [Gammaproteobacteria bacterium]|nr:molybdopterin-dependent oxidoreductase [Gammaproteobacteria bacterium]